MLTTNIPRSLRNWTDLTNLHQRLFSIAKGLCIRIKWRNKICIIIILMLLWMPIYPIKWSLRSPEKTCCRCLVFIILNIMFVKRFCSIFATIEYETTMMIHVFVEQTIECDFKYPRYVPLTSSFPLLIGLAALDWGVPNSSSLYTSCFFLNNFFCFTFFFLQDSTQDTLSTIKNGKLYCFSMDLYVLSGRFISYFHHIGCGPLYFS